MTRRFFMKFAGKVKRASLRIYNKVHVGAWPTFGRYVCPVLKNTFLKGCPLDGMNFNHFIKKKLIRTRLSIERKKYLVCFFCDSPTLLLGIVRFSIKSNKNFRHTYRPNGASMPICSDTKFVQR